MTLVLLGLAAAVLTIGGGIAGWELLALVAVFLVVRGGRLAWSRRRAADDEGDLLEAVLMETSH